jgi:membrane-associated protease RseP (regulator of RpoE activity)
LILEVIEDSPAEEAGLKAGDVITKVDEEEIRDPEELVETLEDYEEGDVVKVEYVRRGKKESVEVELEDFESCGFRFQFPKRLPFRLHRFGIDDFDEAEIMIPLRKLTVISEMTVN